MKRKFAVALSVVTLGAAGVMGMAPAAGAATTGEVGAQAGAFYVFEKLNFNGKSASFTRSDKNLANNLWPGSSSSLNDQMSSVKNHTSHYVKLAEKANGGGATYVSEPRSQDKNLGENNGRPSVNNKVSYIKIG
ncbi:peptidase inhibitor family I36 protein [Streptomyces sp. NPDC004647]|uniref:peptidase inhibitor family I36 protein n=1 Tax=Streptomyces sp. NPDC004647 TaxID=3154671 RepID=UPI0033ABCFF9